MKVLMTADTLGGVWTYALELASALSAHDVQIALATLGGPLTPQQQRDVEKLSDVEVFESSYKLEWMDDSWDDVARSGQWLLDLERQLRPDIIHLNGYFHGALDWAGPVMIVAHSCVVSWWRAVKGEPPPSSWDHYRNSVRQGLRCADVVVAPTRAMLQTLFENYGPLPRTQVIANGCDPAHFRADVPKENCILTAGRLGDEAKNIAALEHVAPRLEWPVCVAGERTRPGDGAAAPRRLMCLGKLSAAAMRSWYAKAAIYAHPARYESFGLAPLEAALSRCALVLGDIPSLREVWGDAAIFVNPDHHHKLSNQLRRLIADPLLRQAMADRAYRRALEYAPQQFAEQYMAAYRYLLARHVATAPRESLSQDFSMVPQLADVQPAAGQSLVG